MSDVLSFAEFDGTDVELLPARTVLSMFTQGSGSNNHGPGVDLSLTKWLGLDGNGYGPAGADANGSSGDSNN